MKIIGHRHRCRVNCPCRCVPWCCVALTAKRCWCDCLDSKQRKSKQNNGACVWEASGVCCLLLPWINQCFLSKRWVVRCINKTTQTFFNVCFRVLSVLQMARPCLRHWLIGGGKTKPSGFSGPPLLSVKRDFVLSHTAFPRDSAMSLCSQGNAGHSLNLFS